MGLNLRKVVFNQQLWNFKLLFDFEELTQSLIPE
jgi:hypothetical protein